MFDPRDLAECRSRLSCGSRSFFAASFFLPPSVRDPATVLYAFCRIADDAIDDAVETDGDHAAALARLHERLDRIYRGAPGDDAVDRALTVLVDRFEVPKPFFEALFDGFAWDVSGRGYETLSDVTAYAVRVAGSVGAMMALLMGRRQPAMVARACDLGVAMQLTNIARDVGEDARLGRLYLPRQWLREAGIDPDAWLADPCFDDALGSVIQRLLNTAEQFYRQADAAIAVLPLGCRPGIYAARYLYAEIGREVERRGLDSVTTRAVVSPARKLGPVARAVTPFGRAAASPFEPMDEAGILLDALPPYRPAVAGAGRRSRNPTRALVDAIDDRAGWVVDLFDRLEREDQLIRSRSRP